MDLKVVQWTINIIEKLTSTVCLFKSFDIAFLLELHINEISINNDFSDGFMLCGLIEFHVWRGNLIVFCDLDETQFSRTLRIRVYMTNKNTFVNLSNILFTNERWNIAAGVQIYIFSCVDNNFLCVQWFIKQNVS